MNSAMRTMLAATVVAFVAAPALAKGPAIKPINWDAVPAAKVTLFYPGQTSMEWVLTGTDHGGVRAFKKGDRCFECHSEEAADMGAKLVSGQKAEKTPIPGKRPAIPFTVKAAYDAENLYMRFEFPAAARGASPKQDAENEMKLAMMIDQGKVDMGARAGCWVTCHSDARDMPTAPAGKQVTKYVAESRTQMDIAKRDNWDKLKPQAELDALLKSGTTLDLVRFKSSGAAEQGYVLAERVLKPADDVTFASEKKGDAWVVTMARKLKTGKPGEATLEAGKAYTVGFAVHDDFSTGRFHHVSLDMRLGLGADGEIKAVKQ